MPTVSTAVQGRRGPRFYLAMAASKAAASGLKLLHRNAGQLPGVIAEKLDPAFITHIDKPERIVFVSGTNGKTTTNNLLNDLLRDNGVDLVDNRAGGNILTGVESTLVKNAGLSGRQRVQTAVMELDELSFRRVLPHVTPQFLLVTNLYRDSFSRNANPDFIFFTGYYPETGMLLRQKKEMGWEVPMMGGDAANHADLVKIAGPAAAAGYFFLSPPLPQDMDTDAAKAFLADFKAEYKSLPVSVWGVMAGDAFVAIEAALKAGKTTSQDIADFLHNAKDLPAITGTVGFDKKGDRVGDFYRVYVVDETGAFRIEPKN